MGDLKSKIDIDTDLVSKSAKDKLSKSGSDIYKIKTTN